jgi:hypothetical protein
VPGKTTTIARLLIGARPLRPCISGSARPCGFEFIKSGKIFGALDIAWRGVECDGIRKLALSLKNRKREVEAAEIAIEAERKLGKLILLAAKADALAKGARGKAGPGRGKRGVKIPRVLEPTLLSAGVDKNLAKSARLLGRLDDDDFNERFDLWRKRYNGRSNALAASSAARCLIGLSPIGDTPFRPRPD